MNEDNRHIRENMAVFSDLQIFVGFCRKSTQNYGSLLTFTKGQIKIETEMEVCDR